MEELTYTQVGDYQIPDLTLTPQEAQPIGKYGMLRKTFLKNHKKGLYTELLLAGRLSNHLAEIDQTAREQIDRMMEQLAVQYEVTETLKASDPMKWTGLMNNLKYMAEETVLKELVYS